MNFKKINYIVLALFFTGTLISFSQEQQKIEEVLAQKRIYNKKNPTGMGYKIQLYNGDETSAYRIRENFQIEFDITVKLVYESPEWKVRVGNYKTRLEADRALLEIKQKI